MVNKKIISQKPIVRIERKVKNPRYWSNSNMIINLFSKLMHFGGLTNSVRIFIHKGIHMVFVCDCCIFETNFIRWNIELKKTP